MVDIEEGIRVVAREILKSKKVDVVIGFKAGSIALRTQVAFIHNSKDVNQLIFNEFCGHNLSLYINLDKFQRVGIVANGCISRSIVTLIKEAQLVRDRLFIIGSSCRGVIDIKKVAKIVDISEISETKLTQEELILIGDNFTKTLLIKDYLFDGCISCNYKTPIIYDELIGEAFSPSNLDEFKDIREFSSKDSQQRWQEFYENFKRCIRCYACFKVCPLCNCSECFIERRPQWFGITSNISDILCLHLFRAYHLAGRCVDCGWCVRVCPMNINLRMLSKKLQLIVKERFGYIVGINIDEPQPLATYKKDDPEDFMIH